jgi:dihydrofolate reductase
LIQQCDALLMGRHTYETFAAAWPSRSGDPISDRINSMAKYVVSSTMTHATWKNTTIISGDPVEYITRLKQQPGQHMVQYGFGRLSFALMNHGLIDELRLWMRPFVRGRGGPEGLLYRDTPTTMFKFAWSRSLKNGRCDSDVSAGVE